MSCDRHYGTGNFQICSNNGKCINNLCYCDKGWTGYADFQPIFGYDCDINISSIRALGGICLVCNIIALVIVIRIYFNKPVIYSYDIKNMLMLTYIIFVLIFCTYSILKIIDPIEFIFTGQSIMGIVCSILFGSLYNITLISINYGICTINQFLSSYYRENVENLISKSNSIANLFMWILFIINTILTIFAQCYPKLSNRILIGYCLQFILFSVSMGSIILYILRIMIKQLKLIITQQIQQNESNINDIKTVYERLKFFFRMISITLIISTIPMILFASYSYLRHKATYLFSLCALMSLFLQTIFLIIANHKYKFTMRKIVPISKVLIGKTKQKQQKQSQQQEV